MKKITFLLGFLFTFGIGFSQSTTVKDLALLKTELDTLSKNKLPINAISVAPDGNWTVIYGDMGYSFVNAPAAASKKIKELNGKEKSLKDIDYIKGGWLLLAQDNAFFGDSVPDDLRTALKSIHADKQRINSVSFTPEGKWVVLYERNAFMHRGIPAAALRKLQNLNYRNQYIKQIEFSPNGGWVILYANKGFTYSGIPEEAANQLKKLDNQNKSIDRIFFVGDKWIITTEKSGYFSNL